MRCYVITSGKSAARGVTYDFKPFNTEPPSTLTRHVPITLIKVKSNLPQDSDCPAWSSTTCAVVLVHSKGYKYENNIARLHLALLSVLNHLCSCRAHLIMAYVNIFALPIPLKSPQ